MDGYRIEVSERSIRRGVVRLIMPPATAKGNVQQYHWLGYVCQLPFTDFRELNAARTQQVNPRDKGVLS